MQSYNNMRTCIIIIVVVVVVWLEGSEERAMGGGVRVTAMLSDEVISVMTGEKLMELREPWGLPARTARVVASACARLCGKS